MEGKIPPDPRKRRTKRLKLVSLIMVIFLSWAGYTYYSQNQVLKEKEAELIESKNQVATLKEKQQELHFKVDRLHDDEYIAELARKLYFLSKPGEIIFVVPEEE